METQEYKIQIITIDDNFFIERKSSIESSSVRLYLKKDSEFNILKQEECILLESYCIEKKDIGDKVFYYYEEKAINNYKEKIKDFYILITDRFNELEDWEYPMLITKLMDFCIFTYYHSSYTQEEWAVIMSGIIRNLKIKETINK